MVAGRSAVEIESATQMSRRDPNRPTSELWGHPDASAVLEGVSTVFTSLGRALICLSPDFRVVHTSVGLDRLAGDGAREAAGGRPAEEILGTRLFGAGGLLRRTLEAGELREGWGATLDLGPDHRRDVSITAAPLALHSASSRREARPACDPAVAYLIVLRSHGEDAEPARGPTVFCGMIARSDLMLRIFSLISHLKESEATVLVTGESGTGKELVAKALHTESPRRGKPFVAVNCGALPDQLLESELFGHVRGAFTGAVRDRVGRFELAAGGTLFLDEVGDLPLPLQVKLRRARKDRTFERVGDSGSRTADARIIAATHLDLRQAIIDGAFRDDLYYRLRVVPIEIPPLRRRREDVEPLAEHLLERISSRSGRAQRLAPEALDALLRYHWPGNVRELENALEFAVAVCRGQTIHRRDLPPEVADSTHVHGPVVAPATSVPAAVSRPIGPPATAPAPTDEKARIAAALDAHHWRRGETARALGMSRTTLWRKMRELGLMD